MQGFALPASNCLDSGEDVVHPDHLLAVFADAVAIESWKVCPAGCLLAHLLRGIRATCDLDPWRATQRLATASGGMVVRLRFANRLWMQEGVCNGGNFQLLRFGERMSVSGLAEVADNALREVVLIRELEPMGDDVLQGRLCSAWIGSSCSRRLRHKRAGGGEPVVLAEDC